MEKNEVIKRIREYHIIRDILKDKAIKAHEKDPKYAGIIAVYQSYVDYNEMMALTENIVAYVAQEVLGTTKIKYGDNEI